jgi:hypothetical protein
MGEVADMWRNVAFVGDWRPGMFWQCRVMRHGVVMKLGKYTESSLAGSHTQFKMFQGVYGWTRLQLVRGHHPARLET